jgi:hypothetical protein
MVKCFSVVMFRNHGDHSGTACQQVTVLLCAFELVSPYTVVLVYAK